jgi:RNA polymerase sigma factor (sigma-70 family)
MKTHNGTRALSLIPKKPAASVVSIDTGGHKQRLQTRRDALVEEHIPLVRSIALRVAQSLPPSFDLDDLIAEGNLALIKCATRYKPGAHDGTPFSAFARHRVRGAILDSVRRRHYSENTRPSIDEEAEASSAPTVEISIDRARCRARVRDAITYLPADQRELITRRYLGEQEGRGLARDLASDDHTLAIDALRRRLRAA